MFHLALLSALWSVISLVGKFGTRAVAFLGLQALRRARPEDVPAVMEALAKWQSPSPARTQVSRSPSGGALGFLLVLCSGFALTECGRWRYRG